jgi:hypothetical protein
MFILTFSWLLHFLYLFNYVQLSIAALPGYNTELGIRRNAITRQGRRTEFIVYTSVVEYENSVDQFTDEQIAGLAHQAWDEMKAQHQGWADSCQGKKQEFVQNHRPSMMSAIAIGKEIYFASVSNSRYVVNS